MNNKKIIAVLITALFVMTVFATVSDSDADPIANNWSEHADYGWYISGGTANEYFINTAEELAALAVLVNSGIPSGSVASSGLTSGTLINFSGKTIKLTADIDLSGHDWTPVGIYVSLFEHPFSGTFDGQGHKISNMNITESSENNGIGSGLFGCILNGATADSEITYGIVKNLGLENTNIISGNMYVGGIVGITNGTVQNCYNIGSVTGTGTGTGMMACVGGIAGGTNGTIQKCYWLSGSADKCVGESTSTSTSSDCISFSYGSGGDCVLNDRSSLKDALNGFGMPDGTYPAGWLKWKTGKTLLSPYLEGMMRPAEVSEDKPIIKHTVKFSNGIGTQVLFEGSAVYNITVTENTEFRVVLNDGYYLMSIHASSGTLKQLGNGLYSLSDISSDVTVYLATNTVPSDSENDNGDLGKTVTIGIAAAAVIAVFAMALLVFTRK